MPKRRILCVSFDKMVSELRCDALKEAGYDVTATSDVKVALELLSPGSFDAVIVGHRFSPEEKYLLAVEAEEKSNTRVILVCGSATRDSEIPATSRVYALEGSEGLLSALSALLPANADARSQVAA
jgi:DNA-binding response OmpR family regulator